MAYFILSAICFSGLMFNLRNKKNLLDFILDTTQRQYAYFILYNQIYNLNTLKYVKNK